MKLSDTLISLILALLIGWNIISYIREPADDVVITYQQLKTMEIKVSDLMLVVTRDLGEPKDILQLTKIWGISSLTYIYGSYYINTDTVEEHIESLKYWREVPPRVQDDTNIFKSYCYNDISLDLYKNRAILGDFRIRVAWQKDSYC